MARRIKSRKKSKGKPSKNKLTTNPDFRARSQFPLPPVAAVEARLREILPADADRMPQVILRPGLPPKHLRERVLTLPLMAVLMVTLVWRQLPSLTEALRVLALEGLWDGAPVDASRQALSQRLRALPASLFAQLYEEALERLRTTQTVPPSAPDSLQARFTALWAADGSTLEALRRKLKELREHDTPLGGKMLAV